MPQIIIRPYRLSSTPDTTQSCLWITITPRLYNHGEAVTVRFGSSSTLGHELKHNHLRWLLSLATDSIIGNWRLRICDRNFTLQRASDRVTECRGFPTLLTSTHQVCKFTVLFVKFRVRRCPNITSPCTQSLADRSHQGLLR
jgi:hypothetical protein